MNHTLIPKLIKAFWHNMKKLWDNYLALTHQTETPGPSPETTRELQTKIRALHRVKDEVLAAHRSLYFHEDVNQYLEHASIQQMRTYIANYEPLILQSLAQAKVIYTMAPRLFQFPGFQRRTNLQTRPAHNMEHARAPNSPHKHSRWKPRPKIME